MSDLIRRIRQAQVHAGEQAVIAHLQEQMVELKIEQPEEHDFIPEWATGRATSFTELGV